MFDLMTGTATKPWLLGNMSQNINTYENWWSNFSENMRIVALELPELTRIDHQINQITLILYVVGGDI